VSVVVSDTTPLNYLILIGHVDVLPNLFGKLLIPPAVIDEMQHSKTPATVSAWATSLPAWAEVKAPRHELNLRIGRGEDQAISLAVEIADAALLVDDKKAKREAEVWGLLTIGTLTILDLADQKGVLDFEELIPRLLATNFRVEDTLIRQLLAKVRNRKKN
jgi:predicted nucleic acid-binding protein